MIIDTGYRPRPLQNDIHLDSARFKAIVCHRRFGKTVMAINETIDQALRFTKYPDGRFAYIAPTYKQAKRVAWDYVKHYTYKLPDIKKNESELSIDLSNGARIYLVGADNIDSLRGIYLDGCICDEFGLFKPSAWGEVIRPALADRQGWAIFIGTPAGKNHFYDICQRAKELDNWSYHEYKASETGYVDIEELEQAKKEMTEDEYNQEFECSFEASVRGSVYGKWIKQVYDDKRFTKITIDPYLPVHTFWDLGTSTNANVIWFVQQYGDEIRFVDCYECGGEGFDHYATILREKQEKYRFQYGKHYAPHDISVVELGTGKSRLEAASLVGINFNKLEKQSEQDRVNNCRRLFYKCWFDEDRCKIGLEALSQYREKWDDKLRVYSGIEHDWTSHYADAFGYALWGLPTTLQQTSLGHRNTNPIICEMGDWDAI